MEWRHHRNLVREAETSLHREIQENAGAIAETVADLRKRQAVLKRDIDVLDYAIKNKKLPEHANLTVSVRIQTLPDVAWKTAQSTSALAYMPYAEVQRYADLYTTQGQLIAAEQQAARDAIISMGRS